MNNPSVGIVELQGTWSLVQWVQDYDDGRTVRAFGDDPTASSPTAASGAPPRLTSSS